MRKDGGGAAAVSLSQGCFEMKPFIATLVVLTLVIALYQLPPPTPASLTSLRHPPEKKLSSPLQTPEKKLSSPLQTPSSTHLLPKPTTPSDPNKRIFPAYGNAAALFVQMGAYRGGPFTFAVVGLASKPLHVFGRPWFKCEYISNNSSTKSLKSKSYKMLPDWGYGRVYTVVVVNCTFSQKPNSDNAGGKLLLYAYYGESPKKYEKIVALEEEPNSFNESKFQPPFQYDYLYCGSSLYGNLSAPRIREWMAYHAFFFGPSSHFVFHDAGGVSPEVRAVLEPWIRKGRVTLQDIRAQAEFDGYYYNQFLIVNDCLHRYRHAANWTFYFDVDEYIYVPDGNTLESVLQEFSDYTQFTIEQNPMSSKLCVDDPTQNYTKQWGFEKLVFRESRYGIRRDRKYAIQAKNAYATGVHMSENVIGKTLHKTETKIRYYHYHNTISVTGEPCQVFVPIPPKGGVTWFEKLPYAYDDKMKRLADTIKRFEQETIGTVHV
ncbi:galactan beta-1,4-galactosyltransferase GALS1 [Cinnamomum micranthum f. kanehirae]|uniref:Glycosyltransferase family 92 protein n=1 Tax=Cinnamomum micranthum f. kanehirae TaxID=337451 RepID=A0A3S3M3W2_9MAGN|nr:galactan beta-1,4-galactosyltransferase GALS1 [Cinnamomum micranthum f. kanehirae]